jgi:hypothetical protein
LPGTRLCPRAWPRPVPTALPVWYIGTLSASLSCAIDSIACCVRFYSFFAPPLLADCDNAVSLPRLLSRSGSCVSGRFCNGTGSVADGILCPAGLYSQTRSWFCLTCPAGRTSGMGASACTGVCAISTAGMHCPAGATAALGGACVVCVRVRMHACVLSTSPRGLHCGLLSACCPPPVVKPSCILAPTPLPVPVAAACACCGCLCLLWLPVPVAAACACCGCLLPVPVAAACVCCGCLCLLRLPVPVVAACAVPIRTLPTRALFVRNLSVSLEVSGQSSGSHDSRVGSYFPPAAPPPHPTPALAFTPTQPLLFLY